MSHLTRFACVLCVFCTFGLLLAASGAQTTVGPASDPAPAAIEAVLKARIGEQPGVGIVVGMIDPQGKRAVVTAGSAGEGVDRKLDGDTVFEIGSLSKVFTATLLSEMVQRGEVSLDDSVARFLPPTVRVPSRDGKPITLGTLATHTSGLPRLPTNLAPKDPSNPYADYSVQQMYDFLNTYALTRAVGETYEYSNFGAGLLGHALALKIGKTYEAALVDRVLGPLRLKDTRITLSPDMRQRLAVGHSAGGAAVPNWDLPTLAGAGAIRSTTNDMLTFLAANLGGSPATLQPVLDRTHEPRHAAGNPSMKIGLGWHIRSGTDVDIVWHNGGTGGYHSFAGFDRKRRVGVVVLTNHSASIDDIGFHLLNAQFPLTTPQPPARPHTEVSLAESALEAFVGTYPLSPAFVITVTREGRQLFIQATGQPRLPVFPESDARFFLRAVDAQLTFEKDANGRIVGLVLHQNGVDQRAPRK